jgi:AAA15 family ATPase/GTPase
MLTCLDLRNFRAFESLELTLAPITIFVGPNNSGKSSILSALRILAQTVRNEDFKIPLVLNGPFGQFGTYRDLVTEAS